MINDILHSHVGDFNIWSTTENFAFYDYNLSEVSIYTSVNYASHPHCFSLFPRVESFGTYMIFEGRHLLCDWLIYYCFPSQSVKASRSRKHGDEMFDVHVRRSEYQQNELIGKMKRGMRSLHHHLQVTFSQSVSRLVAYFCRTMI